MQDAIGQERDATGRERDAAVQALEFKSDYAIIQEKAIFCVRYDHLKEE